MHSTLPRASENPFLANDLAKYVPTPKVEEWKYTNIQSVRENLGSPEETWQTQEIEKCLPVVTGPALVLVNGQVMKDLSTLEALPSHITIQPGSAVVPNDATYHPKPHNQHVLGEIAWALEEKHTTLHVVPSASEALLHIISIGWGQGGPVGGGLSIELAEGASFQLIEHIVGHSGNTPLWHNTVRRLAVGKGAHLRHTLLQNVPPTTVFTQTQQISVAEKATYASFILQTGGHISRIESDLALAETTTLNLHSLQLVGSGITHDVTTRMWLKGVAPQCNVTQRNLVGGHGSAGQAVGGHAVFQGKFHVARAAQKTDAYMRCENLLLHDAARVSQKPELEIYADDVKCSHGASTGSLDAEQLFYLKARGIDESTARQLLVSGFVDAQAEKFPPETQPLIRPLIAQAVQEVAR